MKRTYENCSLIKQSIKDGTGGTGKDENGKCFGYVNKWEEPCGRCEDCKCGVNVEVQNE